MKPADVHRMKKILETWRSIIRSRSYQDYQFPSVGLIKDLRAEQQHLAIERETYLLDDALYLAPTGQMIMYPLVYSDPRRRIMRWHQCTRVYRRESNATRYLQRHREIQWFYELHALFPTEEQCRMQIEWLRARVRQFLDRIGLVAQEHERCQDDRFPGAAQTLAYDTVTRDHRAMQLVTIHYLGSKFSQSMGCKTPRYQLCMGFSQRILGALRDAYGDDLRDVSNPCPVVEIDRRDSRKTIRQLAESAEAYYQNMYTRVGGTYRHVITGQNIDRKVLKDHQREAGRRAMLKAKSQALKRLASFIVESPDGAHRMGYSQGRLYYCLKKV